MLTIVLQIAYTGDFARQSHILQVNSACLLYGQPILSPHKLSTVVLLFFVMACVYQCFGPFCHILPFLHATNFVTAFTRCLYIYLSELL